MLLSILPVFFMFFILLVIVLCQGAWIYLDSKERGDKLATLWLLISIFTIFMPFIFPLPLIVYLLITRAFSYKCPNCNSKVSNNFTSCPYCNLKLKSSCPNCKKSVENNWVHCPYCSTNLKKENI